MVYMRCPFIMQYQRHLTQLSTDTILTASVNLPAPAAGET